MKNSKKLIYSFTGALVVVLTVFFLFNENIISTKKFKITDIVGNNISRYYFNRVKVISSVVKRTVDIEYKKIDFIASKIKKSGDLEPSLESFIKNTEYCKSIEVYDSDGRHLWSSNGAKSSDKRISDEFKRILQDYQTGGRAPHLINKKLIFIDSFQIKGRKNRSYVFFIYDLNLIKDAVEGIIGKVSTFHVFNGSLLLINFPQSGLADVENLANLEKIVKAKQTGALRIRFEKNDVTVYYSSLSGSLKNWTVVYAVKSSMLKISPVGYVILALIVLVVLAFAIFMVLNVRAVPSYLYGGASKAKGEEGAFVEGPEMPATGQAAGEKELLTEPAKGEPIPAGVPEGEATEVSEEEVETAEEVEEAEPLEEPEEEQGRAEIPGVLPLEEVEEVEEIEELGEAEIAEEVEEVEEAEESEMEAEAAEEAENVEEVEELPKLEETGETEKAEEIRKIESEEPGEPIEIETAGELGESIEEPEEMDIEEAEEVEELEPVMPIEISEKEAHKEDMEIEKAEEFHDEVEAEKKAENKSEGFKEKDDTSKMEESGMEDTGASQQAKITSQEFETQEETGNLSDELEERIEDDRNLELDSIPDLEKLAKAESEIEEVEEELPSIPEELFNEEKIKSPEDELSKLINEIEENAAIEGVNFKTIEEGFRSLLNNLKIKRGMILYKKGNTFLPVLNIGFSKRTEDKISFTDDYAIYKKFLEEGKVLYIKDNVFKSEEIKNRFDESDRNHIKSVLFYPVNGNRGTSIVVILAVSEDETLDYKEGIDGLKRLKELFN